MASGITSVAFDSGLLIYSEDGTNISFGPLDISTYEKIRLCINNFGSHDIDIIVRSSLVNSNPIPGNSFLLEAFTVEDSEGSISRGGPFITKFYEVPGIKLFITVGFRNQTQGQYRIVVFGHKVKSSTAAVLGRI